MADTYALITGKLIGKHKLTEISPNKTIEGLIGGVFMGTFAAVCFYNTVINSIHSIILIRIISTYRITPNLSNKYLFWHFKHFWLSWIPQPISIIQKQTTLCNAISVYIFAIKNFFISVLWIRIICI